MFDFAWSELGLIAVVAMILIGPKDMPVAIRAVTGWIRKARRMAAEFQTHVDEMVREADLGDIRSSINEIRNFDVRGHIEKAVDADGSLRATFAENPLAPSVTSVEEIAVAEPAVAELARPAEEAPVALPEPAPCVPRAPAFVPPNMVHPIAAERAEAEPPAFIPPEVVQQHRARVH
ncbi:MAG TPA: Sec-independent protein translocase protein TatB [Acetobacteraceae bacterium]|jgi:sec-independent protein translocase protein TatB|nr:Sec-independent protein translocase protein TatB [Acetobacteraceae bacterium]